MQDRCFVVDSPQELLNCRVVTPYQGADAVQAAGDRADPARASCRIAWQNLSGPSYDANYAVSTAEVAQSLGRPLSGGVRRRCAIPLVAPQTLFEDRITRLDLRLSKTFTLNSV